MSTRVIKYGAKTHTMKMVLPDSWPVTASCKLTLTDADTGTALVSAATVTRLTANTTSAIAYAGAFTITLTNALGVGETIVEDDILSVGTAATGYHRYVVDSYDSGTKIVTFKQGLHENAVSGAAVYGCNLTYTLDTTNGGTEGTPSSTWSSVERVHAQWYTTGSDMPVTEYYTILKARSEVAGLEQEFAAAFPSLHAEIVDSFASFERRARERIRQEMAIKSRDMDKIVDSEALREVILLELALLAARASNMDAEQYDRLKEDRQAMMDIIDAMRVWVDDDQNKVEDDDEKEQAVTIGYMRGLR